MTYDMMNDDFKMRHQITDFGGIQGFDGYIWIANFYSQQGPNVFSKEGQNLWKRLHVCSS